MTNRAKKEMLKIMPRLFGAVTFVLLAGCLGSAPLAWAETPSAGEPEAESERIVDELLDHLPGRLPDDMRMVRDFFGRRLPGTLERYKLSLDYTPKFGDLVNREYIRFPLVLSYGLTDRTEVFEGFTPFTPNPFRPGEDQRVGLGLFRTGIRHEIDGIGNLVDSILFGLEVKVPLGRPPLDLADYYGRFRPSVTLAREVPGHPDWLLLLNLMHDRSFSVPYRNQDEDFLRVNKSEFSPGILYQPNELGYLLEYTYRALDEETGFRKAHVYSFGLLWDVPNRRVPRLLPGEWEIDTIYRLTDEDERSIRHSLDVRVKVRFDFPQFFREVRRNGANGN